MNGQPNSFSGQTARIYSILQAAIFLAYVVLRVLTTIPALNKPRELADTVIYLRISKDPIISPEFLHVDRPFVFPFLLQVVHQDIVMAARIQLGLTILAWGLLAFFTGKSFRTGGLRMFAFVVILGLSLVRHLAGWDFVMMTESLSLSMFVLLIACGIWLLQGWRIHKLMILSLVAFIFAFTRDTNAYILLIVAGSLLLALIFRWVKPRALYLVAVFGLVFYINNLSAETSARWIFPFVNVVGKRILPYTAEIQRMEACGMPVTPELLSRADSFANGDDAAFLNDPALEGFRHWVVEHGKSCYIRWLESEPVIRTREVFSQFNRLIYFENVNWYFSRRYQDLLPSRLERFLYPVYHVSGLYIGLSIIAVWSIIRRAWRENVLWAAFILLCLAVFPHLFITWHGDAMAPERHAISVGLQLSLTMWLLIFLALDKAWKFIEGVVLNR